MKYINIIILEIVEMTSKKNAIIIINCGNECWLVLESSVDVIDGFCWQIQEDADKELKTATDGCQEVLKILDERK